MTGHYIYFRVKGQNNHFLQTNLVFCFLAIRIESCGTLWQKGFEVYPLRTNFPNAWLWNVYLSWKCVLIVAFTFSLGSCIIPHFCIPPPPIRSRLRGSDMPIYLTLLQIWNPYGYGNSTISTNLFCMEMNRHDGFLKKS